MKISINFSIKNKYVLIAVILLGLLGWYWHYNTTMRMSYNFKSPALGSVLNYSLGIPISTEIEKERGPDAFRMSQKINSFFDKLNLSPKEWRTKSCTLGVASFSKRTERNGVGTTTRWREQVEPYSAELRDCIFGPIFEKNFYSAKKEYCGSYFNPDGCMSIHLNEYILNRPDMLDLIIKIAKTPCAYLPSKEKLEEFKKINKKDAQRILQNIDYLNCWETKIKKNEKVILNFYDLYGNYKYHFVINREE